MEFPFTSIPEHLQVSIAEKFDLRDFLQFRESSMDAFIISQSVTSRFTFNTRMLLMSDENDGPIQVWHRQDKMISSEEFEYIPIRVVATDLYIQGSLTSELCSWLTKYLLESNSKFSIFTVGFVRCDLNELNTLLEILILRQFACYNAETLEFAKLPAVKEIRELQIGNVLNDSYLSLLKTSRLLLHEANISSTGMNLVLREWINGDREIIDISISTSRLILRNVIFEGIPHTLLGQSVYKVGNDPNRSIRVSIRPGIVKMEMRK